MNVLTEKYKMLQIYKRRTKMEYTCNKLIICFIETSNYICFPTTDKGLIQ